MTYGDRAHFDRWAADKRGRAKTPEFYVRSHEPDLPRAEADAKAASLREQWGMSQLATPKEPPKAKRAPSGTRRAAAAPAAPAAPASPAEKALAAYAEALRRKAVADERVRELQGALNAAIVERDACDLDIRETWSALEALNQQITAGTSAALELGGGEANGNGKREGRRRSG